MSEAEQVMMHIPFLADHFRPHYYGRFPTSPTQNQIYLPLPKPAIHLPPPPTRVNPQRDRAHTSSSVRDCEQRTRN
jgi:hypothetical protein